MTFIVNSLLDIIATLCIDLINFCANLSLKLGIPAASPSDDPLFTLGGKGYFDEMLPGVQTLKTVFITIGIMFALCFFMVGLLKSMIPGELLGENVEEPAYLCLWLPITIMATTSAYLIMTLIQAPMHVVSTWIEDAAKNNASLSMSADQADLANINFDTMLESFIVPISPSALGKGFICVVLLVMLAAHFVKLTLEIVERYVALGLLFYVAPIPLGFMVSSSTRAIPKKFALLIMAQYFIIAMNLVFLFVFLGALNNLGDYLTVTSINNTGEQKPAETFLFLCVLIAWLRLGGRVDEVIQGMGIPAVRTGYGLGHEMVGAMVGGYRIAKSGAKFAGSKSIAAGRKAYGMHQNSKINAAREELNSKINTGRDQVKDSISKSGEVRTVKDENNKPTGKYDISSPYGTLHNCEKLGQGQTAGNGYSEVEVKGKRYAVPDSQIDNAYAAHNNATISEKNDNEKNSKIKSIDLNGNKFSAAKGEKQGIYTKETMLNGDKYYVSRHDYNDIIKDRNNNNTSKAKTYGPESEIYKDVKVKPISNRSRKKG